MEITPIELELRKVGLTEKEVRVYLAGLELGLSSVQNIVQKAGILRPTNYEIIKKLKEKELFVEAKEKNKKYFVAQSPERILGIQEFKKEKLKKKKESLSELLPPWKKNTQRKKE